MLEFMQNPDQYIDQFSDEFKEEFMHLLSHRWPHSWVLAVKVHHCTLSSRKKVHLHATIWDNLNEFVKHLQDQELVEVQESDEGLLVKWIDHSPKAAVVRKPVRKTHFDLTREIEKLGVKGGEVVLEERGSELLPHQGLSIELLPSERKHPSAAAFTTEEVELSAKPKHSALDTLLQEETTQLDLKGAVFKIKQGPAQGQKAVVVRTERSSFLLRLLRTGDTLREPRDNLEIVLPVIFI